MNDLGMDSVEDIREKVRKAKLEKLNKEKEETQETLEELFNNVAKAAGIPTSVFGSVNPRDYSPSVRARRQSIYSIGSAQPINMSPPPEKRTECDCGSSSFLNERFANGKTAVCSHCYKEYDYKPYSGVDFFSGRTIDLDRLYFYVDLLKAYQSNYDGFKPVFDSSPLWQKFKFKIRRFFKR